MCIPRFMSLAQADQIFDRGDKSSPPHPPHPPWSCGWSKKSLPDRVKIKNVEEYQDFYVQSDTLLLADIFENFRNICLQIYELDPFNFLTAPRLSWQATLKKTKVKLDSLTNIDMLLLMQDWKKLTFTNWNVLLNNNKSL